MKKYIVRLSYGAGDCIIEVNYIQQRNGYIVTENDRRQATIFTDKDQAEKVMHQAFKIFDDVIAASVVEYDTNKDAILYVSDGRKKWVL